MNALRQLQLEDSEIGLLPLARETGVKPDLCTVQDYKYWGQEAIPVMGSVVCA